MKILYFLKKQCLTFNETIHWLVDATATEIDTIATKEKEKIKSDCLIQSCVSIRVSNNVEIIQVANELLAHISKQNS